jgi:Zn-dependent metalloprotease
VREVAPNRAVCDANRKIVDLDAATEEDIRCGATQPFKTTRAEGQPASGTTDVDNIYSYFGTAQSFYAKYTGMDLTGTIGADYGDGNGKQLRGTVRMCETHVDSGKSVTNCPWLNAFWDGEQMAFGEGLDTLDVTGHELTHGVTQHTSGLSGGFASAINEGISDVFAKFMAFKAGDPNDAGPNRWLLGVGTATGQARDMKDPAKSGQGPGPDRVNGEHWVGADGDPHVDALVVDKTDYLITDGGTGAYGLRVRGIGEDKSIALWWKVENLLRPTSTFRDLGVALNAACVSNARMHVAGTGVADCVQVAKAVAATQLLQAP